MFGRSIRIYLSDASPSGLKHLEIVNWSGQAIACPRSRFSELKNWGESQRPVVYFLLEKHSTDNRNMVYIGESENVFKRLADHDRKKDFWNEVIIFTSKDENLTKAHVKYLESRLTSIAIEADRYTVENGNTPPESSFPRADKADMEEFIHNLKIALGTLGHRLLEQINSSDIIDEDFALNSLNQKLLYFNVNGISSKGKQSDEGFILIKDSEVSKETSTSIPGKVKQLRLKLIEEEILIEREDKYIFPKDIVLSSSSYAAALVAGTSRSGPQSWKNIENKSLKQLEEQIIKSS